MKTRVKLKPGQNGTKKLVAQYGKALLCVRYRYDEITRKQLKTVEIIVSEREWAPPQVKYTESELVALRIGVMEKNLQKQVKAVGGYWDQKQKVWLVHYGCIAGTELEKFIIVETSKKEKTSESLYK